MKTVILLDYGMGNLRNVQRALEHVGAQVILAQSGNDLQFHLDAIDSTPCGIVLPGVGNFGDGMRHLRSRNLEAPIKAAIDRNHPFLGICLGMQMLFERSEEAPDERGLGILSGEVVRFPSNLGLKVPHMGWNAITTKSDHHCQLSIPDNTYFYFVHSYHARPTDPAVITMSCNYGYEFTAAVGKNSLYGAQFHPEKSQEAGLTILRNFLNSILNPHSNR